MGQGSFAWADTGCNLIVKRGWYQWWGEVPTGITAGRALVIRQPYCQALL